MFTKDNLENVVTESIEDIYLIFTHCEEVDFIELIRNIKISLINRGMKDHENRAEAAKYLKLNRTTLIEALKRGKNV